MVLVDEENIAVSGIVPIGALMFYCLTVTDQPG